MLPCPSKRTLDQRTEIEALKAEVARLQAERDQAHERLARAALEAEKFSAAFEMNPVAVVITRLADAFFPRTRVSPA